MAKVYLNFVNDKLIHERTSKNGRVFYNVSVPTAQSENGYGSIAVSAKQVQPAKRKDRSINDAYKTVILGNEDGTHSVSVKKGKGYTTLTLTNKELADGFEASRKAYAEAQAEA